MTYSGAESSKAASETEENRKRHRWECLRRRLICDYTRLLYFAKEVLRLGPFALDLTMRNAQH